MRSVEAMVSDRLLDGGPNFGQSRSAVQAYGREPALAQDQ